MEYIIITLALFLIVFSSVILVQHLIIKGKDEETIELNERITILENDPIRLENTQLKTDLELQTSLAKTFEQRYDQLRNQK